MKIYTRTGDEGRTGLIGGRVSKDDVRVEAYGTTDELNSFVGAAINALDKAKCSDMLEDLLTIQHELFDCGADLALANQDLHPYKVTSEMVDRLEVLIDRYDADAPDIARFILPGGTPGSSALHVCRTVCRRAERRVVTLAEREETNVQVRRYLNRLSDLFFTLARAVNAREDERDAEYVRSAEVSRGRSDS